MLLHPEVLHQLLQEVGVAEGLPVADLVRQADAAAAQRRVELSELPLRGGEVLGEAGKIRGHKRLNKSEFGQQATSKQGGGSVQRESSCFKMGQVPGSFSAR